jgi:hypothetical protein
MIEPDSLERAAPSMTLRPTKKHMFMAWIESRQGTATVLQRAKSETKHRLFFDFEQKQTCPSASPGGEASSAAVRASSPSRLASDRNQLEKLLLAPTSTFISRLSQVPCLAGSLGEEF